MENNITPIPTRWLNTKGIAKYIGYSVESVNKFVQQNVFILNKHYYKKRNRLIFDIQEVDKWIMEDSTVDTELINSILKKI